MSKLGAWLFLVSLVAACASVLGIEERQQDSASNYPIGGYEDCRPGNCRGCLDVHRQECQLRTTCAESAGDGNCAGCVCENCLEPVVDCQLDPDCAAIWQCLRDTRCDLSERATSNCADTCGNVIQANGGVTSPAFRAAAEIRSCATTAACLSCLAPQVQQTARTCTPSNGCQDCPECFDRCLCSGEKYSDCLTLCDEAPHECTQADACAGCTNCFDTCTCGGATYEQCVTACTVPDPDPPPAVSCTPDDGCAHCTGCAAQCVCSGGGDQTVCDTLCAPPATTEACVEDPTGASSVCGGCESSVAQCTCDGRRIEYCVSGYCDSGVGANACGCTDGDAECISNAYGSSCYNIGGGPCEACACNQCPGEFWICDSTLGCRETFECMRSTNCQGQACLDRCRRDEYPVEAFAYAEAQWACYQGAQCTSCNEGVVPTIECPTTQGNAQCHGFVGYGAVFPACCPGTVILTLQSGSPEPIVSDDNVCGLDIYSSFRDAARPCEPLAQSNPPRYDLLETCPDTNVYAAPYNGALLKGCCRGADLTCGYYDDITGLGCLSAGVFGQSVQPCP